jgi:hypothetical protein
MTDIIQDDLSARVHVRMRKDDGRWMERDFTEQQLLQLIRILFKENRNKALGYFFYSLYNEMFGYDWLKKNLDCIGLTHGDFETFNKQEAERMILQTLNKRGHNHGTKK